MLIALILTQGCSNNVKVGWIGPLTGDAAIIGEENLRGVRMAAGDLEVIAKDDQLNEREMITAYRELVDIHNVDYILTVNYGGFIALAEQAERDGVILINSLDASEELANIGENSFAIGIYDEGIGYALADYVKGDVGVIYNLEDPFILLVKEAFEEKFGEVEQESYTFDTVDFRTILTKFKDKDNIVLIGWEETGRIVKQARELGIESEIIGIDTFASADFRENAGEYEGLAFTFWEGKGKQYEEMISKYSGEPENVLFVATGYDAMSILKESLSECGDVDCVKGKMRVRDFEGATGKITVDEDGITRSVQEVMYGYKDGEIVKI